MATFRNLWAILSSIAVAKENLFFKSGVVSFPDRALDCQGLAQGPAARGGEGRHMLPGGRVAGGGHLQVGGSIRLHK